MADAGGTEQGARRTGPALESMYGFLLWLVPTVEKFPRRQKYLLGDRLQATALDVLERWSRRRTRATGGGIWTPRTLGPEEARLAAASRARVLGGVRAGRSGSAMRCQPWSIPTGPFHHGC